MCSVMPKPPQPGETIRVRITVTDTDGKVYQVWKLAIFCRMEGDMLVAKYADKYVRTRDWALKTESCI